jgi:hypothetical protein
MPSASRAPDLSIGGGRARAATQESGSWTAALSADSSKSELRESRNLVEGLTTNAFRSTSAAGKRG